MRCDSIPCLNEARVGIIDWGRILISLEDFKPGQIIECDDPASFHKFCKFHWNEYIAQMREHKALIDNQILEAKAGIDHVR
jgi:hypothetical protein